MPKKVVPDVPFQQKVTIKPLKILVTIVHHGSADVYLNYLYKNEVAIQLVLNGEGAHERELANILGLEDVRKDVIISIVQAEKLPPILDYLRTRFSINQSESGIAFTIPLQSLIGVSLYKFLSNSADLVKGSK
ncbi:MAG: hypothetical protein EOM74_06210 [Methanomicrobia archaeon]|nr:hypothetical protein [Methanomicrobia archaeon]